MSKKIDAMVAEKVMKWPKQGGLPMERPYIAHEGNVVAIGTDNWSPSTDPAAMMVVKEALLNLRRAEFGGMTSLSSVWNPYECRWEVKIDWSSNRVGFSAMHGKEPMAWCLLALRVAEVPESEIQAAMGKEPA